MTLSAKKRRRGRERAMQFLCSIDFTNNEWREALGKFWDTFDTQAGAREYADAIIEGVFEHRDELDAHITAALKNWAPERVGRVERNILRVALYEMTCAGEVPDKVAINEAIELAKLYAGDDAPRFINGVLDRLRDVRLDTVHRDTE